MRKIIILALAMVIFLATLGLAVEHPAKRSYALLAYGDEMRDLSGPGEWFTYPYMRVFVIMDRNKRQWLVDFEEGLHYFPRIDKTTGQHLYRILLVNPLCVKTLGNEILFPKECVAKEEWMTWEQMKKWLLNSGSCKYCNILIPAIERNLAE